MNIQDVASARTTVKTDKDVRTLACVRLRDFVNARSMTESAHQTLQTAQLDTRVESIIAQLEAAIALLRVSENNCG